ncbi:DUF5683 domain-containing protein [Foetidibacter luteolus]|uniref:DUF5683 domain-containing protein n=1 Tax=Foetidibacter luteolus TaxID=2608880 RepID=UPI00129AB7AC|nr:DUF5683 domain-containing protein [Foetidibacter luteolus]
MKKTSLLICLAVVMCLTRLYAQDSKQQLINSSALDTARPVVLPDTVKPLVVKKDSVTKRQHIPSKATIRSAIFPGLGQIYNRQYWKLPLVYAAVGIPAGFFFYNNTWYKKTRTAYDIVVNGQTERYGEIDPALIIKSTGQPLDAESLQFYRNAYRRDRDYSILYFLLAWGVQVVDATVSGHLKNFDVSEDISMNIQPTYNTDTRTPSLSVAFNFKKPAPKKVANW